MYPMKAITLSMFHLMMFPHEGKVVTIDQLTYYEPRSPENLDNVLPNLLGKASVSTYVNIRPDIFKDSSLLGTYASPPPYIPTEMAPLLCTIS